VEAYYALGRLIVIIAIIAQSFILLLQGKAYFRHRKPYFALLFAGAAIGLVYAVLAGLPLFMTFSMSLRLFLARIDVILLAVGSTLGVWGFALLLGSYQRLAQSRDGARN